MTRSHTAGELRYMARDVAQDKLKALPKRAIPECLSGKAHRWVLGEQREGETRGWCRRCRKRYTFTDPMVLGGRTQINSSFFVDRERHLTVLG